MSLSNEYKDVAHSMTNDRVDNAIEESKKALKAMVEAGELKGVNLSKLDEIADTDK